MHSSAGPRPACGWSSPPGGVGDRESGSASMAISKRAVISEQAGMQTMQGV